MGNDANPSGSKSEETASGFQFYMVLIMLVLGLLSGAYVSKNFLAISPLPFDSKTSDVTN